jgi:hypothetical protein
VGASWEGFALEQIFQTLRPVDAFFWATHNGAEIDLFFLHRGQRYGVEVKFSEAPTVTRSMRIALQDLSLHHLWIIYPGRHRYLAHEQITVWPLREVADLPAQLD